MKKTVLITGSTRGIGRSIAEMFAKKKYTVIVNGLNQTIQTKEFINRIKKQSTDSSIYYFNVASPKEVEINCQKILAKYKQIDILINNAGIVNNKLLINMSYDDFDRVIKTNLYGTFLTTKYLLPSMIKSNWGRIINMSSISGIIGDFGQTNYSASKAAIIGFTKSLSKEVARYNITVNSICPGLVATDILKNVPEKYLGQLIEKIPLRKMAQPEEIANLVWFLASNQSSYITGEYININGGWY